MRALLYRLLKVPPEPALPPGSHESVRVFRAAKNFCRLLLLRWGIAQLSALAGIVASLAFLRSVGADWSPQARFWVQAAEYLGAAGFILQMPFTFLMVRLDYELRWYVVTDRSLRIRSGLIHVREMTMTFANIQHITVHQGPLQRLLGLSDLQVRTAGGGGGESEAHQGSSNASVTHLGYFRGVDNAPAIRDLIIERMKRVRDAGLGDPDDTEATAADGSGSDASGLAEFRAAVGEVRTEAVGLRQVLRAARS